MNCNNSRASELSVGETSECEYKSGISVIIVANRLPITIIIDDDENIRVNVSSGGLVAGLKGLTGMSVQWLGWPGSAFPNPETEKAVERECLNSNCIPVFLDDKTIDYYYNGFCNNILWPLFHYIPPPFDFGCVDTPLEEWQYYIRANMLFTDVIVDVIGHIQDDADMPYIWVHDYHLMLVPMMLRKRVPQAKIGWFLHTPFPSQEVFRMLPFRTEILTGLLSANLVAFHVYDYTRHFLGACSQLLGLETTGHGVDASPLGGDFVRCASIPIGIEPEQFLDKIYSPAVSSLINSWRHQFGKRKIILGIDRLDYMKGIPHKLNAFDRFLERYPEWIDKCIFIQLAVPSRTMVPEYQKLKSTVHEMVGKINGKRGNLTFVPVHYLDQSVNMTQLVALYRVADCAFITSLRDGMNLVAYEFIVCQKDLHGTLVLSEFAGASQSLGAGSITINPWNIDSTAKALLQALTMSPGEKRARNEYSLKIVTRHTSQRWAETFLTTLTQATMESQEVRAAIPPILSKEHFCLDFKNASSRLVVVDLMDCLVRGRSQRGLAMKRFQSLVALPPSVLEALKTLGNHTELILSSAHPQSLMARLFDSVPATLMAEKGCVYRRKGETEWKQLPPEEAQLSTSSSSDNYVEGTVDWQKKVARVVDWFQRRTPGSYCEQTSNSITWYWDDSQPDLGQQQARDLLVHLWAGPLSELQSSRIEVVVGPKSLEIRPAFASREKLMTRLLNCVLGSHWLSQFQFVAIMGTFPRADESVYSCFEDSSGSSRRDTKSSLLSGSNCTMTSLPDVVRLGVVSTGGTLSPKSVVSPVSSARDQTAIAGEPPTMTIPPPAAPADSTTLFANSDSSGVAPSSSNCPKSNATSTKSVSKIPNTFELASVESLEEPSNSSGASVVLPEVTFRKFYSITVSSSMSKAKFRLPSVLDVQEIILKCANIVKNDDSRAPIVLFGASSDDVASGVNVMKRCSMGVPSFLSQPKFLDLESVELAVNPSSSTQQLPQPESSSSSSSNTNTHQRHH